MGRPAPIPQWATTTNFPLGSNPWNGQPTKVAPAGTFWTPNTKPAAEEFNFVTNQITAGMQTILDWSGQNPALNWQPYNDVQTAVNFGNYTWANSGGWHPGAYKWMIGISDSTNHKISVATSPGMDAIALGAEHWGLITQANWVDNTKHERVVAVCNAPGSSHLALSASINTDGSGQYSKWDITAGSVTQQSVDPPVLLLSNKLDDVTLHVFQGLVLVGGASVTNASGAGTGTFVGYSSDLLANINRTFTNVHTLYWNFADNGSRCVCVPALVSGGGAYYYTDDGTTFNAGTVPGLTGAEYMSGVAFGSDAFGPCWIISITGAGSGTRFARSADGVTWVNVPVGAGAATANVAGYELLDLQAIGDLWIATQEDLTAPFASFVLFSVDGCETWRRGQAGFKGNEDAGTSDHYRYPQIRASQTGFIMVNSDYIRLSYHAGLPPAL